VIGIVLRWFSIAATAILLLSFGLFAIDQAYKGSSQQVAKIGYANEAQASARDNINQANPTPRIERARERRHLSPREALDDVNDLLISPFAGITDSTSIWLQRGLPTMIALLVFGVGVRMAAGYAPVHRPRPSRSGASA